MIVVGIIHELSPHYVGERIVPALIKKTNRGRSQPLLTAHIYIYNEDHSMSSKEKNVVKQETMK